MVSIFPSVCVVFFLAFSPVFTTHVYPREDSLLRLHNEKQTFVEAMNLLLFILR
jgi:hypothetical protein